MSLNKFATSVSEGAREIIRAHNITIPKDVPGEQQKQLLEAVNVMQGSIWEYSDSQPWFLVGLHKNNPTATRHALESIMHFHRGSSVDNRNRHSAPLARRGTVTMSDGEDGGSFCDSEGHLIMSASSGPHPKKNQGEGDDPDGLNKDGVPKGETKRITMSVAEEMFTHHKRFVGNPQTKIVIRKTVELIGDMSKSSELVFHAVRACARFLTYPTPSVPSDNFIFGHIKGWIWLIYKGFSHFNYEQMDTQGLDICLKVFRKEMSLLAKETNECAKDFNMYMSSLKKLNVCIAKEAKFLKKKHKREWQSQMDRYFHFVDDLRGKHHLLVDINEDRFFPTDWIFEPHPSQTKLHWDFFHFQWIDMKRDWLDSEFEVRSDYSLHWKSYSTYSPNLQTEIIVHLIQHAKALIEECHQFHKTNFHLSFDSQEIKFLKFAVEEISKLRSHKESVEFITSITKKLFEDLAVLEKICREYRQNMDWLVDIIDPCYHTMNRWLPDELILPLEFPTRRNLRTRGCCGGRCMRQRENFPQLFGEPLSVVLLRSPISLEQKARFFPSVTLFEGDDIMPSSAINSYGVSEGYASSIFDAGLGRDAPLPIHHPLPKYKKRRDMKVNIFDIHRLIESTIDCLITKPPEFPQLVGTGIDVDIEKYIALMEEVQRFLAVFSTIYSFMMIDLKERVEILEFLMYNNLPEHYETLEKMITYEQMVPPENQDKSGVKAFGRLHKIFQFVVFFLEKTNSVEENDISYYPSKWAYYKSYAKVQGWIYQKAAIFSMYSLPSKKDMFQSLFADKVSGVPLERLLNEFIEHARRLIDTSESLIKLHNINIQ